MTTLPAPLHRGACGRGGRLCSLPPVARRYQEPSLAGGTLRSSTCDSLLPLAYACHSCLHELSRELACPRVAGQCPDMRLLKTAASYPARHGKLQVSVCGDLPFDDGSEVSLTSKICSIRLRNRETEETLIG
jgi:hypothetical protein